MQPGHAALSFGAVLIGPFEGSRWRGGCGESLWDLNGAIRFPPGVLPGLSETLEFRSVEA